MTLCSKLFHQYFMQFYRDLVNMLFKTKYLISFENHNFIYINKLTSIRFLSTHVDNLLNFYLIAA